MTETIRIVSAMTNLMASVTAFFAPTPTITIGFGYRERTKQINQSGARANRVIFLPGDPNGAGGKLEPSPRDVGLRSIEDSSGASVAEVRSIASWARQLTISIWGWDAAADRDDELAHAAATEALFELTVQAVEQAAGAGGPNMAWGAITWTVPQLNAFGTELLVGCAFTHPLFDAVGEIAFPGFELARVGSDVTEEEAQAALEGSSP